jgi:hypothetical protein
MIGLKRSSLGVQRDLNSSPALYMGFLGNLSPICFRFPTYKEIIPLACGVVKELNKPGHGGAYL